MAISRWVHEKGHDEISLCHFVWKNMETGCDSLDPVTPMYNTIYLLVYYCFINFNMPAINMLFYYVGMQSKW